METNKQNTALLVVIAVATLLVAVVGATFAYFTAQNNNAAASTVTVKAGIMTIKYADGSDAVNLKTTNPVQPGDATLVEKIFTLEGKNTTTGNGGTGLDMPYTIDLEFVNSFTNDTTKGGIEYTFERTDSSSETLVTVIVDTASGMLDNTFTQAGDEPTDEELTVVANKDYLRLAHGVFKPDASASTTISFKLKLYFKDTGANQDDNKNKVFRGRIIANKDGAASNKATTAA